MNSNEDKRNSKTEQEYTKDSQPTKIRIENPFIAFRRFADETIGSALQSLIGLPSVVSKQLEGSLPGLDKIREENAGHHEDSESFRERFRKSLRKESADDQAPQNLLEELRKHRQQHRKRWEYIREAIHQGPDAELEATQTCNMSNDDNDRFNRAIRAMEAEQSQNRDASRRTLEEYLRDSRNDSMESFIGGMLNANIASLGSSIFERFNSSLSPDNRVTYLLFSPYSPLFLNSPVYDPSDKKPYAADTFPYCDAFEDLMLASQGREMVPLLERRRRRTELSLPLYTSPERPDFLGFAMSWFSRLHQQGLLENFNRTDEQSEEDDGTELGMYQRFLSGAFPKSQPREEQSQTSDTAINKEVKFGNDSVPSNGGVLSTLTRTESKRYPDGRVETKVVLIKRFADGGETRTETVRTDHEGTSSSQGQLEDGKQTTKEEKKGWFWN